MFLLQALRTFSQGGSTKSSADSPTTTLDPRQRLSDAISAADINAIEHMQRFGSAFIQSTDADYQISCIRSACKSCKNKPTDQAQALFESLFQLFPDTLTHPGLKQNRYIFTVNEKGRKIGWGWGENEDFFGKGSYVSYPFVFCYEEDYMRTAASGFYIEASSINVTERSCFALAKDKGCLDALSQAIEHVTTASLASSTNENVLQP